MICGNTKESLSKLLLSVCEHQNEAKIIICTPKLLRERLEGVKN
jgi:hypothetical protein